MDADKLTDAELLALLEPCPPVGSRWTHYRAGDVVIVTGCVIREATREPMVEYMHVENIVPFARPLSEWEATVEWGGQRVPRFRPA